MEFPIKGFGVLVGIGVGITEIAVSEVDAVGERCECARVGSCGVQEKAGHTQSSLKLWEVGVPIAVHKVAGKGVGGIWGK